MARILVIDDEKNLRRMVELTLRRSGHEVVTASDGPGGLALMDDDSVWDLAIVDERMPGMTGRAVIRAALSLNPAARIIMMTAFASIDLASEAIQIGAIDFLRKPFSAAMLRRAASAALSRPTAVANSANGFASTNPGQFTHYLNGINYRKVDASEGSLPSAGNISHAYRLESPGSPPAISEVVIMPHVVESIGYDGEPSDSIDPDVWETICGSAIAGYIWEHGAAPPTVLPIYELTGEQHDLIRRMTGRAAALPY